MFDSHKIDAYFNGEKDLRPAAETMLTRRAKIMRWIKLALPSLAALLIGLLIVLPGLQTDDDRFELDVTRPKKGELEKLHMENTVFYITDGNHFLFVLMPFDSFIGSQVDFFGGGRGCNQQGQSRNNKKFLHYSLPFNFSSGMVIWVFPVKIIKFFLL